jgi:hypothetical protein
MTFCKEHFNGCPVLYHSFHTMVVCPTAKNVAG